MSGRNGSKELAYARLKRAILSGALRPGAPIAERALAQRYRLSRTPIREILHRLHHEQLVVLYPRRGAFVRQLETRHILEIFDAREAVEPIAARLAAAFPDHPALDQLTREFAALRLEDTPDARAALVSAGRRLHDHVVRACGNAYLQQMYAILQNQSALVRTLTRQRFEIERESYAAHLRILSALRAGDPEGAEASMREHLCKTREHLMSRFFTARGPMTRPSARARGGRRDGQRRQAHT